MQIFAHRLDHPLLCVCVGVFIFPCTPFARASYMLQYSHTRACARTHTHTHTHTHTRKVIDFNANVLMCISLWLEGLTCGKSAPSDVLSEAVRPRLRTLTRYTGHTFICMNAHHTCHPGYGMEKSLRLRIRFQVSWFSLAQKVVYVHAFKEARSARLDLLMLHDARSSC